MLIVKHGLACAMQMLLVVMCRLSSRASPRTSRNVIVGPFRHQIRADACIPAIPVCFTESSNYMISTIVSALLPTVVTLLLGFFAGWHHDFDAKQATVLNRMVMLYALPLNLFAGMVSMRRDQILSQGPLAIAIVFAMAGGYAIVFVVSRYFLRRDLTTAALRALTIS